jgi:hypothetical protein
MNRILNTAAVVVISVSLTACADFHTIGRTNSVPSETTGTKGKVIHLDAQQRVVIHKPDGTYCAEASSDALAAYVAALALGVSVPGQGAGSGASASSSNVGSIGLRTQSITLMRDSLYRLCETTANGTISDLRRVVEIIFPYLVGCDQMCGCEEILS